mgnify:FL=1
MSFVIYSGKKIRIESNKLDLSNLGIKELDQIKKLDSLKNLEVLDLSHNKIKKISNLGHLSKLEELNLAHNSITTISGIDKLKNLKTLNLSHNNISEITGIYSLFKLKELNLRNNNLSHIPNLLKYLAELAKINLAQNEIKKFPESLRHFVIMDEFKVNKYITLKLENYETMIYVKNRRFNICKYLLLHIPISKMRDYDTIDSIDEAAETLDSSLEYPSEGQIKIMPFTEFWGHCSNLQVWAENDYDSRLLHRNLAFPLLKKLADEGDPKANRVFKEEIAKRIINGNYTVFLYLLKQGYLSYLTESEIQFLLDDPDCKFFDNFVLSLKEGRTAFKKAIFDVFIKLYQINQEFLQITINKLQKKNQIRLLLFFSLNNKIDIVGFNSSGDYEENKRSSIIKTIIDKYLIKNLDFALSDENFVLKQTALRFLIKFYFFISKKRLYDIFSTLTPEVRRSIIELLIHDQFEPNYETLPETAKHSRLPLSIKFELIKLLVSTYNLKGTSDEVLYHLDILYPQLQTELIIFLMVKLNKMRVFRINYENQHQKIVEEINPYIHKALEYSLTHNNHEYKKTVFKYIINHLSQINQGNLSQTFGRLSATSKDEILRIIVEEHRNPRNFTFMKNAHKLIEFLGESYSTIENIIQYYDLDSKDANLFSVSQILNNRETLIKSVLFLLVELQFAEKKELKQKGEIEIIFNYMNIYLTETLSFGLKNETGEIFEAIIKFLIKFFPFIKPEYIFGAFTSLSSELMEKVKESIESSKNLYKNPQFLENINELLKIIHPDDYFHFYI